MADSPRWCEHCGAYGDHHTDRHCDHAWCWRRKRNQGFGYWECIRCNRFSEKTDLDARGNPASGPPEPGDVHGVFPPYPAWHRG